MKNTLNIILIIWFAGKILEFAGNLYLIQGQNPQTVAINCFKLSKDKSDEITVVKLGSLKQPDYDQVPLNITL